MMTSGGLRVGALILLSTAVVLLGGAQVLAQGGVTAAALNDLRITVSQQATAMLTGESFTFTSEVTNTGSESTPPLIANLAFVALDHKTYVDPEDWSGRRTQDVGAIPAGQSATQTWTVKAVLAGDVAVYVVVLPEAPEEAGSGPLVASAAIPLHVTERRPLNPGGVLPVVLVVPALVAVAFAGLRLGFRARR
jgi:hypothetical protein